MQQPADELARTLADHFRAGVRGTGLSTSRDRAVMLACKEILWRRLLGVTYTLTVPFARGEG